MDRLVESRHGGVAGSDRLALQQHGESVFASALFHDTANVSWLLFPNDGSHDDPRITGLIVAFTAAIVTVVWGPRPFARYSNA
jgi:CAAX protease family protein